MISRPIQYQFKPPQFCAEFRHKRPKSGRLMRGLDEIGYRQTRTKRDVVYFGIRLARCWSAALVVSNENLKQTILRELLSSRAPLTDPSPWAPLTKARSP